MIDDEVMMNFKNNLMMMMASVAIAYSANECTKSSGCIVCAHRESLFIFDRVMGSHVVHCVFFYH